MGKQQVGMRLKEVVYTLSPFEQNVMSGLFKDIPHKVMHHLTQVSTAGILPNSVLSTRTNYELSTDSDALFPHLHFTFVLAERLI